MAAIQSNKPPKGTPKEKKTIAFAKDGDEAKMSTYSRQLIEELRAESNVTQVLITSAVRTVDEQAGAMYKNEMDREKHKKKADKIEPQAMKEAESLVSTIESMNKGQYGGAKTAAGGMGDLNTLGKYTKERSTQQRNDIGYKDKHGHHAKMVARKESEKPEGQRDQDKTLEEMTSILKKTNLVNITAHAGAIGLEVFDVYQLEWPKKQQEEFKKAVLRRLGSSVYRFGFPDAPSTQETFNDKVYHIEINQPKKNDAPTSDTISRTA